MDPTHNSTRTVVISEQGGTPGDEAEAVTDCAAAIPVIMVVASRDGLSAVNSSLT